MSDIENIKNRLDVVDLVGSYVELKRAGSNYKGLCPFHNEKTPSFMVNPNLQIYKCFGCGKGGDVLNFIQEYERVDFPEALKIAAEKAGVELTGSFSPKNKEKEEEKAKIVKANEQAAKYYNYILKAHSAGKPGEKYAKKRGIGAKEIHQFMIGYAPKGKENLKKYLLKEGYSEEELVRWGLLVNRDDKIIDKFRDRLLQPVRNTKGEVVGFSGRYIGTFEGAPKYLNSPETLVFKKNELLYGLFEGNEAIRKEKKLILVEGNIDIISSHRVGVGNIAAPLGTAFTEGQARLIKRFADEVLLCFDPDEAGQNALIRSLGILERVGLKHKVIDVGEYQDADELINKDEKLWSKIIKKPINTVEYLLGKLSENMDLGNPDDKSAFLNRAAAIVRLLKDDVQKQHFTKEISLKLELPTETVERAVREGTRKVRRPKVDQEDNEKIEQKDSGLDERIKTLLALMLRLKDSEELVAEEIELDIFSNQMTKDVAGLIVSTEETIEPTTIERLTTEPRELLEEIMLMDVDVEDIGAEFSSLYNRLYKEFIREQIMSVRKELSEKPDDEKLMKKLAELTRRL